MAYDPNDPADKKIVDDAVKAAVAKREGELAEEHEADIEGLKAKNTELTGKLRKARAGGDDAATAGEIERLETELAEVSGKLRKAESDLRTANRSNTTLTEERDTAIGERDTERNNSRSELINSRLTAGLAGANVAAHFVDDVTASLARKAEVKEVDGKREAFIDGKPLGEFLTTWAEGPGKHYITAPNNGGGGSPPGGGGGSQGGKRISDMTQAERTEAYRANPADFDRRVAAGENVPLPKT